MFIIPLSVSLSVSIAMNLIFLIYLSKLKNKIKARQPDANAQEVLSELMAGPVVMKIELIEKGSIVQWRAN